MITTKLTNIDPEELSAMECQLEACVVERPTTRGVCDCRCSEQCVFKLPVFADTSGNARNNDNSDFLFKLLSSFDTGALELWKYENGTPVKKDDLDNTNTYGTFYDLGTWTQYPNQELYFGYFLEWLKVFNAFGAGQYFVRAELTILAVSQTIDSDIFVLNQFDHNLADETIKIKTVQNGQVRRSAFDFTGMNWQQEIRLPGFFGFRTPELKTDRYLDEDYVTKQVQDEIVDTYTMEINKFMNGSVCEDFIYSRMLANEIYVTDYNRCTTEEITDLHVVLEEFSDVYEYRYHSGRAYEMKFTEAAKDRFKRNFK
jgi:hypothetical protein